MSKKNQKKNIDNEDKYGGKGQKNKGKMKTADDFLDRNDMDQTVYL